MQSAFTPFAERGMIRERELFFNREEELNAIFSRLATMQSVSIVGKRRIGKSSLLYRISEFEHDRLGPDYELHYIDMQRVLTSEEFYQRSCMALGHSDGTTRFHFEEALEHKRVILCLDEFERTTNNRAFGQEFFAVLRSLAQTGELALVVATQHTLTGLYDAIPTSPFQNIFTLLTLEPFSDKAARQLIMQPAEQAGSPFSPSEVELALELAGTHPYRLNLACSLIYDAKRNGRVDRGDIATQYTAQAAYGQMPQHAQTTSLNGHNTDSSSEVNQPSQDNLRDVRHEAEKSSAMYFISMLVVLGLAIGWFSIRETSPFGIFVGGAVLLIALARLIIGWRTN